MSTRLEVKSVPVKLVFGSFAPADTVVTEHGHFYRDAARLKRVVFMLRLRKR